MPFSNLTAVIGFPFLPLKSADTCTRSELFLRGYFAGEDTLFLSDCTISIGVGFIG